MSILVLEIGPINLYLVGSIVRFWLYTAIFAIFAVYRPCMAYARAWESVTGCYGHTTFSYKVEKRH